MYVCTCMAGSWMILLTMFSKAASKTSDNQIEWARGLFLCLRAHSRTSHSFFLSLEVEPGHCVVDIMPCGSPVHLPPRGMTLDRSYMYMETSSPKTYCCSVVHVTLKLMGTHEREDYILTSMELCFAGSVYM